jgi:hypothetical protein
MQRIMQCVVLLVVVGILAAPTFAAELRVTGFIDNSFPHWDKNMSSIDQDTTRSHDMLFAGRTRMRNFFNFIANDNLRGVFAIEIDQTYGAPSANRLGSGCVEEDGAYGFEQCGFDNGIDNNAIEIKQVYVDFRVPQLPIGNRWRLGGRPLNVTPLHSPTLYTMDSGGGDVRFDFSDQVSLFLYYTQLEEDLDRFRGSTKLGEDYLTGGTLMLKPLPGLDFHILGVYGHGQNPFGPALTGGGGPFNNIAQDFTNVTTESRYYLGFDSRYRFGNTSIEPGFLYLLGSRNFCTPGTLVNSLGTRIPCTSPAGSPTSTDYDAFQGFVVVQHTTGPWLLAAKFNYASGDSANNDINNRGIGSRSDVKGFRSLGVDTSHFFGEWFELLGKSDVDGNGQRSFRRMGEAGHLDRFGWMDIGGKAEYQYTENLVLVGAAGGFWTADKTGCPARFRLNTTPETCRGPGSPLNSSGQPAFNFTGNSNFVGWEVNAGVRYTIMPGLSWTPLVAYADYGKALDANNRKAMDAWAVVNRVIYIF